MGFVWPSSLFFRGFKNASRHRWGQKTQREAERKLKVMLCDNGQTETANANESRNLWLGTLLWMPEEIVTFSWGTCEKQLKCEQRPQFGMTFNTIFLGSPP